jgi:TetR/AcrR family transcriptional regulator, transcriptional repressor for nem operon
LRNRFIQMPKVKLFDIENAKKAAINTFWKKGYHATSMHDLVEAMQISKQSLYDTFGNKNDLFISCLSQYQKEAFMSTCEIFQSNLIFQATLKQFFDEMIRTIINDPFDKNCFIMNSLIEELPSEIDSKNLIDSNFFAIKAQFLTRLERAQEEEKYQSKINNEQLANYFLMSFHGIKILGKINKDKKFLDGIAATTLQTFFPNEF